MGIAKIMVEEEALLDFLNLQDGEIKGIRIDDIAERVVFLIKHDTLPSVSCGGVIRYIERSK